MTAVDVCGTKASIERVNLAENRSKETINARPRAQISADSLHRVYHGAGPATAVSGSAVSGSAVSGSPVVAEPFGSSHESLERFTNVLRQSLDRGINRCSIDRPVDLLPLDETIDRAITPPITPSTGGSASMFSSNNVRGIPRRKISSLKGRRSGTGMPGSTKTAAPTTTITTSTSAVTSPDTAPIVVNNPTITVTGNNDDGSVMADFLSPDKKYRKPTTAGAADSRIQIPNLGDEASLYGTPKEEMSPLKEVETSLGRSASNSATNYVKDQIISFFQPSDNKLAMKLFGNKNALMKEKMRQKAAGNWVIHPCSNFRSVTANIYF